VRNFVTGQHAGVGRAVVGDGRGSILRNHIDIKIHQSLPTYIRVGTTYAVGGVTCRTGEASINVALVLAEAGVCHDVAKAVAFAAHRERPIYSEIGVAK